MRTQGKNGLLIMGLTVSRNKENQYQLISSFDNKRIHDAKWISEQEAKKLLIDRAFWRFFKEAMEIDCEFPGGYSNNGRIYQRKEGAETGAEKYLRIAKSKNSDKLFNEEWERLKEDYKLNI